jgi:hypothetical protein
MSKKIASFHPPRLWKCTLKAQTRSFCYLSPDARKKDTHALHHPSLARSLSLSLSLSQHICITLAIASHLQRIWARVHKHPWLHVNACGVSKSFEQFRCSNEEENRSRRTTRRSYIYICMCVFGRSSFDHGTSLPVSALKTICCQFLFLVWWGKIAVFRVGWNHAQLESWLVLWEFFCAVIRIEEEKFFCFSRINVGVCERGME